MTCIIIWEVKVQQSQQKINYVRMKKLTIFLLILVLLGACVIKNLFMQYRCPSHLSFPQPEKRNHLCDM